jgi:hypothetical protein
MPVMTAADDYCDFCDLPTSQCMHGRPAPAPAPTTRAAPSPRKKAARARTPGVAAKPVQRRWSPPEVFRPLILTVLEDAGGRMEADEVFGELELRAGDLLLAGDREKTPQGELRWRSAARRARQELIDEGVMTKGRPGVWQLAERPT